MNRLQQALAQFFGAPPQDGAVYQKISAREAYERLAKDPSIVLVDVRTEAEYRTQHIPHSRLVTLQAIEQLAPRMLPDKDAAIVVYCQSGMRSQAAARKLLAMGYRNIVDMGGIALWPYETVTGAH